MRQYTATILSIRNVTHDVRSYRVQKPKGYRFNPGQAAEVSINRPGWETVKRSFSFTSTPKETTLEFIIKSYTEHHGLTDELYRLHPGDSLIISEAKGAILYKEPGYFIAGGTGITPFVSIFRQLHKEGWLAGNKLFFSSRTTSDVILHDELRRILRKDAIYLLSREENVPGYASGHIDEAFLKARVDGFGKYFYICGPTGMVEAIKELLLQLGVSAGRIVTERSIA